MEQRNINAKNMVSSDQAIKDSDLKFRIELECGGLDLSRDRVECEVSAGNVILPIPSIGEEPDLSNDATTTYDPEDPNAIYVCFNTSVLPCTSVWLTVTAYVPDEDFPDGYRKEIAKTKLCNLYPKTQ